MRYALILLITSAIFLLSGCLQSDSDTLIGLFEEPLGNPASVDIKYESSEKLAPAEYQFTAILQEFLDSEDSDNLESSPDAIATYQWSFSDEEYELKEENQTSEISHTFNTVGAHYARLNYKTVNGLSGLVEKSFFLGGGSISGTISIALNNLVDSDTRDPSEPRERRENNTFETAQALTSETLLSGIVDSQDPVDFYRVQLQENQRLMVQMADEDKSDGSGKYDIVKLSLYADTSEQPKVVETSADTGRFEGALVVETAGSYYLKIEAVSPSITLLDNKYDHGIYTLSIDAPRASSNAEFALGEVNVLLKPNRQYMAQGLRTQMDLGRFKTLSLDDARALMGSAKITYASTPTLNSMGSKSVAQASLQQQRWEVLQAVEILSQHDDIEIAEPNWKRYALAAPLVNDPDYASQWHYDTINLPKAWSELGVDHGKGVRGKGVVVAVIDTGVLTGHPDLSANMVDGYDYVDNDSDANDTGDKSINGQRSSFHGTHVAGTIAASANDIGGIGVAPNVKIMPIRVLGEGGGYASHIIAGVCFAAKLNIPDCKSQENYGDAIEADVINLSLGGEGFSELENRIYKAATAKGIIVIAAAGNEGVSVPFYPAAYDSVISVSAVSQDLTKASYSNFADPAKNSKIDVAAPGGDFTKDRGIYSTLGDDSSGNTVFTYGSLQGTSMAAPHVAGIAALMKSVKADLKHAEFVGYLNSGKLTHDLGDTGKDNIFGNGLIDAHKAILAVKQNNNSQLLSSSNQLFFNMTQDKQAFVLSAVGVNSDSDVGELSVSVSESSESWLSVRRESDAGSSSNTVGLGNNTVTVNRTGLDEGSYEGAITITPETNTDLEPITIKVTLQVGNAIIDANAGVQYVLVIKKEEKKEEKKEDEQSDSVKVIDPTAVSIPLIAVDGQYTYKIKGELPKGDYIVATGSDLDLDNMICDPGESCGQYPTLDRPTVITISEDQTSIENINMTVGFIDIKGSYTAANYVEDGVEPSAETTGIIPKRSIKAYSRIIKEVNGKAPQSNELKKTLKTINLNNKDAQ